MIEVCRKTKPQGTFSRLSRSGYGQWLAQRLCT